jgi:hypothetical protein
MRAYPRRAAALEALHLPLALALALRARERTAERHALIERLSACVPDAARDMLA